VSEETKQPSREELLEALQKQEQALQTKFLEGLKALIQETGYSITPQLEWRQDPTTGNWSTTVSWRPTKVPQQPSGQ
jgi:hypothetical protein